MQPHSDEKKFAGFGMRVNALAIGIVALCAVLCLRLWQLQIVHGDDFARQAENNRLDYEIIKAPRGIIYGRDETVVLADNRAACDLVIVPALCEQADLVTERLEELVSIDGAALLQKVRDAEKRGQPFLQITVKPDITRTERMRIEEFAFAMPGVFTIVRPERRYHYNETASQILGWFNEISKEEYEKLRPRYKYGDIIGRAGIEMAYESWLKGEDGAMIVSRYNGSVPQLRTDARGNPYVEVDSRGRPLAVETRHDATPGRPVFTTLDIELQRECERILRDELYAEDIVDQPAQGAIVVLNADTGEVLAMASVPTYDPNIFATKSPDQARRILDVLRSPEKPMLSRAFQTHYPPGSVFKVALAIAGLEEGVIGEHSSYSCGGQFRLPGVNRPWRCWKRGGHGSVNVVDALAYSCDVFFYNVGRQLGPEKITLWCNKLGLGVKTGIDLPGEVPGLIMNPALKRELAIRQGKKEPWELRWYDGETINMSIGQGMVDATPLQNAVMMAAVLNGGRRVRPYVNREHGPEVSEPLISDRTLRIVHDGMLKCVEKTNPPSGTGKEARVKGLEILGKTGTAQVAGMHQLQGRTERQIPYKLRDHALFVSGVMNMEPRIAVSVMVEHGLHGSSAAAPVARKVYEYFYLHKAPQDGRSTPPPLTVARHEEALE